MHTNETSSQILEVILDTANVEIENLVKESVQQGVRDCIPIPTFHFPSSDFKRHFGYLFITYHQKYNVYE